MAQIKDSENPLCSQSILRCKNIVAVCILLSFFVTLWVYQGIGDNVLLQSIVGTGTRYFAPVPGTSAAESMLSQMVQEQQLRLRRLDSICQERNISRDIPTGSIRKYTSHLIVDDEYKILFNFIPKVSCTSWKSVFNHLYKNHSTGHRKMLNKYSNEEINLRLETYRKAVFVREPITRVLSAYLSKFHSNLRLQRIWEKTFGRKIVKQYRSTEEQSWKDKRKNSALSTKVEKWLNITFNEFVRYITDNADTISLTPLTDHFLPMNKVANPCSIRYDFIGHFEELSTEAPYMLKFLGVDHIVQYPEVHDSRAAHDLSEELQKVPLKLIRQLREYYMLDYQLFGYSFNDTLFTSILA